MQEKSMRLRRAAWSLVLLSLGAAWPAHGLASGAWVHVDSRLGEGFETVLDLAAERLEEPRCSAVLSLYSDQHTGEPIEDSLVRLGVTPAGYLKLIVFTSGEGLHPCERREVLAYTSPGSRVVFVCRVQFLDRQRADGGYAANIIIHELLHSLGAGENPPSPREITESVERACGR